MKYLSYAFVLFGISVAAGTAAADTFRVPKIESRVKIDAVLDEEIWETAVKIDANIEVRPGENIEAPVKTETFIAYDTTNIYVAFKAYDPDPSQIQAHLCDRDKIYNDDWVLILFDTFNDSRRSYDFFCNPLGIQGDQIESSDGGGSWDAIWESEGRITSEGYIVEMAIPFSCMSFQPGQEEQTWRFDIVRSYPRKSRHHIGSFPRDRNNNCYMCQAHQLVGFAGVDPGNNLEMTPTFSTGLAQERSELANGDFGPMAEKGKQYDLGLTGKWGITQNMTLSFTANPDFSQIETDTAQMDINNRFPLYYSERRPFFLENGDIFNTGTSLVHTRTLADPEWGVKLTGKKGKNAFGAFAVRDSFTPLVFSGTNGADNTTLSMQSTGTVLRFKRDIGKSSNIGVLVTDREGDNYHNRVAGLDASLKFTQKDQLNVQFYGTETLYPGDVSKDFNQHEGSFGGTYAKVNYQHATKSYDVFGYYSEISPDFRSDLGFMTQTGYRYSEIGGSYKWRGDADNWYSNISLQTTYRQKGDWNFAPLNKAVSSRLNYNGPMQSFFATYGEYGKQRYEFKDFRMNYVSFWTGFKPSGSTQLNFSGRVGDQIDYSNTQPGNQIRCQQSIEQKIGNHLTLDLNHNISRLNVTSGRLYTANVSNFKVTYQFNKRTFLRTNLQFSDYRRNTERYIDVVAPRSNNLFSQVLLSYKINPQTVFFLGYSDNYGNRTYEEERRNEDDSLIQKNRAIFTKIGYALAM